MTKSKSFALPPCEFNNFLLAEVGTQANGLSLTVLSLLARSGRDPWAEARHLANLTNESAIVTMTAAITASPACIAPECDPTVIAARLIARLPSQINLPSAGATNIDALAVVPPQLAMLILWVSIGVLLLITLIRV